MIIETVRILRVVIIREKCVIKHHYIFKPINTLFIVEISRVRIIILLRQRYRIVYESTELMSLQRRQNKWTIKGQRQCKDDCMTHRS